MLRESPHSGGILETAEAYWKMNLPIIPLRGKIPAIRDWQNFHRDAVSIRYWFGTRRCNIGLLTGDYVVIDSDCEAAERWLKEQRIDSPMQVRSGRGGLHRYFDGRGLHVRNWQGLFGIRGLDGRGHGGFIVFPTSMHPETGQRYEFLSEMLPVEKLPPFRLEWITPVRRAPSGLRRTALRRARPTGTRRPIEEVRKSIHRTFAVSGHGGHNATFAVACELAEAGLCYDEVLAELCDWNETNAIPRWDFGALKHKARDAIRKVLGSNVGGGNP